MDMGGASRQSPAMRFIEAFPAAAGPRLAPLVAPSFTTSRLLAPHQARESLGPVHALGVWEAEDLTIGGFHSHLFIGAERFADTSVTPRYVNTLIYDRQIDPRAGLDLPERVINEPVAVFMGWGRDVYGGSLIELMPKIRIAAKALGRAPGDICFLLPQDVPGWFRQLLELAGARRFLEYDQAKEKLLVRKAWVATVPVDTALHPACRDVFSAMRPPPSQAADGLIFITRRAARVTRPIQMNNADEIEKLAAQAGLRIVSPEQAPVMEQARLFANARLVVGEYGSALMNAVFCRPGAVVAAIGTRSKLLSAISTISDLRASFFDPTGNVTDPAGYSVEPGAFSRWLDALLKASNDAKQL